MPEIKCHLTITLIILTFASTSPSHKKMKASKEKEKLIRAIVRSTVAGYASAFCDRHLDELDDEDGTINMKIHNVFIASLGSEIQFYSSLSRSLDSSLGKMLEKMAIIIAKENYDVSKSVVGKLYREQIVFIAELLEDYTKDENRRKPLVTDYLGITKYIGTTQIKEHASDYCLFDEEKDTYYLIELKIGGDLDNKKARSEKETLLEQFCILANSVGENHVKILFATAYNRYGEGKPWLQSRVRQFFADDELCISRDFWNLICKADNGYDIVIDEYKKNAHQLNNIGQTTIYP